MKIQALCHMYPPMHNAGAEHMLHAMLSYLVKQGHSAEVIVLPTDNMDRLADFRGFTLDGVKVTSKLTRLGKCDIMFTHLDRTELAERICYDKNIPLVQVLHNEARVQMMRNCDLAVYNTEWLSRIGDSELHHCIVHPPVWEDRYKVENKGNAITLINLQQNKGAEMFYYLASRLPQYRFIGVMGSYGHQLLPNNLPNVEIWENQKDIRKVYEQTHILLMPSAYESYGRCAIEAAVSGIPTIANPTNGLLEALSDAGTYPLPDSDSWLSAIEYVEQNYAYKSQKAVKISKQFDSVFEMKNLEKELNKLLNSDFSAIMEKIKQ